MLHELRHEDPSCEIRFWCDKKFAPQARRIISEFDSTTRVDVIAAGKFRRYNHVPMWRQLLWPSVVFPNIRDGFRFGVGFIQSITKLLVWRPDVVFTKGGFVCLPVGLAARILRILLVIHDSDAHPGLTNRILAKWATTIATGAPLKHYSYPSDRSHYVGIPVGKAFQPFTPAQKAAARKTWSITSPKPLIVITGGGLGAQRINNAIVAARNELKVFSTIVLISGAAQYDELRARVGEDTDDFQLHGFVTDMVTLLGAADGVVARAGATTILELAALGAPTILIPNAQLTGGHQVKNAQVYEEQNAVIVVNETELLSHPEVLIEKMRSLVQESDTADTLRKSFLSFAKPLAAKDMAQLISIAANRGRS